MMIINITSIADFPFLIIAWGLNSYLFLVTVRLFVGGFARIRVNDFYQAIQTLSDPYPRWLDRKFAGWLKAHPRWLAWVCVIFGVLVLRQLMVGLAALVSP